MEDNHLCCGSSCTGSKNRSNWRMIFDEFVHHFPYAIFSVSLCFVILGFLRYTTCDVVSRSCIEKSSHILFHSFHFLHIVFSATGSMVCYFRFSRNILRGLLVGIFATVVFCTLSDAVIPYLAGCILGVDMSFHLCFLSHLNNVLPFLGIGLLNGLLLGLFHNSRGSFYSVFSHFVHILISSLASTFYMVSHGFFHWDKVIGLLFLFLVIAVVIPCTLSDVVVPMAAAKAGKKNERN